MTPKDPLFNTTSGVGFIRNSLLPQSYQNPNIIRKSTILNIFVVLGGKKSDS